MLVKGPHSMGGGPHGTREVWLPHELCEYTLSPTALPGLCFRRLCPLGITSGSCVVSLAIKLTKQQSFRQDDHPLACGLLACWMSLSPRPSPLPVSHPPLSLSRYLRKAVSCASVFPTWGSCPVGGFLFPLHTVCAIATPCGPSGRALRSELTHLQGSYLASGVRSM